MVVDFRYTANRALFHVELDLDEFLGALGLTELDKHQRRELVGHIVLGLARESLIDEDSWDYVIDTEDDVPRARSPHIAFHPAPLGAELFLWGCGSAIVDQAQLLDAGLELVLSQDIGPLRLSRIGNVDEEWELRVRSADDLLKTSDLLELRSAAEKLIDERNDAAPGYFYLSLFQALSGDQKRAEEQMLRCARYATREQRSQGLRTLDRMMTHYPNRFELFLLLAKVIESAPEEQP